MTCGEPDLSLAPGIVIDHWPQCSGQYIGSPSIVILANGDYIASHDLFGPDSGYCTRAVSRVFRSRDRGETWTHLTDIDGMLWSNLFVHRDAVYLMGTECCYGRAFIRRSVDSGKTWTEPVDAGTGVLFGDGRYHCGPMPTVEHEGRLWRAVEAVIGDAGWPGHFHAFMASASVDADLLDSGNWVCTRSLVGDTSWCDGRFRGWLEGNAVVAPDDGLVDVLRVDDRQIGGEAAVVCVSRDGTELTFDPATGFVGFPGANTKFTIRHDPVFGCYWSVPNYVPEPYPDREIPATRNTMALTCSPDLRSWEVRRILLQHPDPVFHAFQYPDWQFDGDDIVVVSRTAYDDGVGGAHNFHDANFMTFHRVRNFRY